MAWIKKQTIDGKKWTQTDGCPIGKSRPWEIAEIYMDWFEKNYMRILQMRDDVVLIWKKGDADLYRQTCSDLYWFLLKLNCYENSKQFTFEKKRRNIAISRYADKTGKPVQQKFIGNKLTHKNIIVADPTIPMLFLLDERPNLQGSATLWFEKGSIRSIKYARRCVHLKWTPNRNC